MIIKKLFLFFVLLNLFACSQISFVYNDSKTLLIRFTIKLIMNFQARILLLHTGMQQDILEILAAQHFMLK